MRRAAVIFIFICAQWRLWGGDTLRIVFIGDVMQHREQLASARISGRDSLSPESYDYSSCFRYTRERLSDADLAVANMEFPCGAPPYRGYPSFSAPSSLAAAARDAGIDVFLCANNHICDRGARGIRSTLDCYDSLGIFHTGLYRDTADFRDRHPLVVSIRPGGGRAVRVALINFTYGTNGISVPPPFIAAAMDTLQVRQAVASARSRGAEYIIALPHWGQEYNLSPSAEQRRWQMFLYRCGVDAIVGSHPHVTQPVRTDGDGITVFSLGNFISNMSAPNTQAGWMFTLSLTRTPSGKVISCGTDCDMTWCPRDRGPADGWTTVMVDDFRDAPEKFRIRAEYDKMMNTFVRLKNIFSNDGRQ